MRKCVFRRPIMKQIALVTIAMLLAGCIPEVTVNNDNSSYTFGAEALTDQEKALKAYACSDDVLKFAIRDLPEKTSANIYQHACAAPDKAELGKTLKSLGDEERVAIERRLKEKGLIVSTASLMTTGEMLLLIGGMAVVGGAAIAAANNRGGSSGSGGRGGPPVAKPPILP